MSNEELIKKVIELLNHGKDNITVGGNSITVNTFKNNNNVTYKMPNLNSVQSKNIKKNR